ncbi:hypothetical protein I7I53_08462 [Histoplasma capsulatum var. duboisii H88]|uniref:Uncharacterized protein n=1 Tax=Ajellomyces capsulatus (strain H88) TaxID=544711 RepID=A0A8A1LJV7_AJEC8|nr:hypothetical protein I7I53_08462 [Histoplasma capsulatum var. duboisii H88]
MSKDFVKFVLEGTIAHPNYEDFVEDKRKKNKKLAGADEVKFAYATSSVLANPHVPIAVCRIEAHLIIPLTKTRRCEPRARFFGEQHPV